MCSSASGDWILPKGGWEKDETAPEAAARETHEEAGCLGIIASEPLVDVAFSNKRGEPCRLLLFVMEVQELCHEWPESHERRRRLFSLDEALAACRKKEHVQALEEVKARGWRSLLGGLPTPTAAAAITGLSISTSSISTGPMTDMASSVSSFTESLVGEEEEMAN